MTETAVVILNYNGKNFLEKYLPGVIRNSPDATVVVADNASTDDSVDFMKKHFPQVRLLINDKNTGFAGGYNWALSQIEATYYVLLNSDIEVTPDWLEPVIRLMDSDEKIAACQPKIRSVFQKEYFEYAGASGGFIDRWGYPFCRGRIFEETEKDQGQYDDVREIFWATGACMIVRADVYHALGGLDADFFAHMEEIDFCWRAKNQGYKIMVQPASIVYHVGGGTLPKSSARKTYLNFRNNFMLLYKNLPDEWLWKVLITRLFMDGLAGIRFLLQGHFADIGAIIRAHFYFYGHLKTLRAKRRKLRQKPVSGIYMGSLVFARFIKKIRVFSALQDEKFT
ncbi:glycosyltransferase family 2 protein [Candidatus Sulfidibacterium hydrothermale]|uniref:glycosyltransferase family 2 protein n=1 Tax=Candidatus Sulfidibacterium hydrothermale TaxID=2875962 RepID=UPI001F0AD915|nr:glycosyltransferase family 2 protein [Candidatus Sulfidibacterium hydrothermale]UBM61292.1 glycosyltransferase family 2 protein [Candidatus Sulfidibacterium hydrothermale]